MDRNTVLIDTSTLLDDPNAINKFEQSDVIIPFPVLKELDAKKGNHDEVGRNARETIRLIDGLEGDISQGVDLDNGATVKIQVFDTNGKYKTTDDKVIYAAESLKNNGNNVRLISQDINMRVRAKALKVPAEPLLNGSSSIVSDQIYSGVDRIELDDEDLTSINSPDGQVNLSKYEIKVYPNQFLIVENDPTDSTIGRVKRVGEDLCLVPTKDYRNNKGLECKPRNMEQNMAINLMLDKSIDMVSLIGMAGTGKTLLALAAALHLYKEEHKNIIITKPQWSVGKDMGFLPGTAYEKTAPWMGSIFDNLRFLLPNDYLDDMMERGHLRIEPLQLFRGRSIPNSVMIIDELQNCSKLESKTFVTRAGANSKVFFTADLNQIDNPYVDSVSNGAAYCVEKLKPYDLIGHITLVKGERSALASLAADVL